jgi:CBS domain containing-hemolysin-like protein
MAKAGHIPSEGESIEVDGYLLVAGNVTGQRIGSVTVEALDGRAPLQHEEAPSDSVETSVDE